MQYEARRQKYLAEKKQTEKDLLSWLNRAEREDREKEWLAELLRSNLTVKSKEV